MCWRRPIFPGRFQPSIFGAHELNYRVRDGNGWTLIAIDTNYSGLINLRHRPDDFAIITLLFKKCKCFLKNFSIFLKIFLKFDFSFIFRGFSRFLLYILYDSLCWDSMTDRFPYREKSRVSFPLRQEFLKKERALLP